MSDYVFQKVFYRCISPLHVGCGQDVGIVDLPVIRERTTNHPYVPGSGLRGVLRDRLEKKDKELTKRLLGSDRRDEISAGCVSVLDARILLFPVRSSPGVFKWLTCPFVLTRYQRDQQYFLGSSPTGLAIPKPLPGDEEYLGPMTGKLYLEEYPFSLGKGEWSWSEALDQDPVADHVVLVSNPVFDYFVRNATIVTQHNRLTSAKTVEPGALFAVESVPPETVFYGFLGFTEERSTAEKLAADKVREKFRTAVVEPNRNNETYLMVGGDESTGLGITRMTWK